MPALPVPARDEEKGMVDVLESLRSARRAHPRWRGDHDTGLSTTSEPALHNREIGVSRSLDPRNMPRKNS